MMMLRAAALALLAEAKVVRETLYRITPRNYTGVTDLDTGDAAGDAHFGLYEKSAPVVCDAKLNPRHAENILCENDALLQIPGFNVYIAVEVEMDDRFGDYAECNPTKSLPHAFNCTHWHHDGPEGCWNANREHPEWATAFAGLCDADECLCDAVETRSVGREFPKFGKPLPPKGYPELCYADFYPVEKMTSPRKAAKTIRDAPLAACCSACAAAERGWCRFYSFTPNSADDAFGNGTCALHAYVDYADLVPDANATSGYFSGDGLVNFVESASMTLSEMMNGSWYSTQGAGECLPGQTLGEDCFWRVLDQTSQVNATCVNDRMIDKIVAQRAGDCFHDCDDPNDQDSFCWIECFFETIVGNSSATPPLPPTNRSLILDAFTSAFAKGSGCPEVPDCPAPCLPPCWAVPKGDPCTDEDP